MTPQRRDGELAASAEATLAALGEEVEAWGGHWRPGGEGGELEVPVAAGLRVGRLRAAAATEPAAKGCRLVLTEIDSSWRLQPPAVAILALAALAGLAVILWPFFPNLVALLPMALVLSVAAWLFVVARLRNQGLEELLAATAQRLETPPDRAPGGPPQRW